MFQTDAPTKNPLFTFYPPLTDKPIGLLSIPHSGEEVPAEFRPYLMVDEKVMLEDVDYKVNELVDIQALQLKGVGVLVAHVHRVCVDLNRAADQCVLFWKQNTKGVAMVGKNPTPAEEADFIRRYHAPFFEVYGSLIRDLERQVKGKVSVIDLHSMPSSPTEYHMRQNPNQKHHRADFCVSDQRGKTCEKVFIDWFAEHLTRSGHETAINDPYIGGYVTTFVDQFRTNNIQIEIKRGIYMDETTKVLLADKARALKERLTQVFIEGFEHFKS